ncbi:glutamine--fructose-6-phosphate transaminase (isomerizing) [Paenarthrobacter aromaticivorans]|uniref:Glutamine--fructose-6-phosphate aminotransferase [isomerizing] n=1 Tax=Paenarthrobacter aromaticivorans TaxID=2849150 RepID=A0ABS6HZ92_9MICC|nr:glutamine--fructose-6-phosphate transaminase (isomerizing) [Paenarthrobacter sp. MMS21-TAE1-1]MBU8864807.1 glutamine--fructose-6-phosphate transaminase (isomerizing) [Paenarthrobacter sp. MMS21-TAE1-1]
MCGIVGYVGKEDLAWGEHRAVGVVMGGLRRLEYRGYDSAGIALLGREGINVRKKAGKLGNLEDALTSNPLPSAHVGIGHTRWATHGAPTDGNAHPHLADHGRLAVVHNGIIENSALLKRQLEAAGHAFSSDTDTEVAAALLADAYRTLDPEVADDRLAEAMRVACAKLEGSFTLLAVHRDHPGLIVAARRNSPLVIGRGEGENFLGSDVAAFADFTRYAIELGQDQVVSLTSDKVTITDFSGAEIQGQEFHVDWDPSAVTKDGYPSFMAKEIQEQPDAVRRTLQGKVDAQGRITLADTDIEADFLMGLKKVIVIACGTASYSGQIAKYAIERWARVPVEVDLAHEFRYRSPMLDQHTLVLAISQSGETMDTLMAVRYAREQGARVLAVCNTPGATIPRESDAVFYTQAGPEVAVASTKAFLTQVTAVLILALYLAQLRDVGVGAEIGDAVEELRGIPEKVKQVLASERQIKDLAGALAGAPAVLFIGRHVGYPVALEGALKLKELAYTHAEGFAAGELKHGPIALLEPGQVVVVIVPSPIGSPILHAKTMSTIQEIKARGATIIGIAEEGDSVVNTWADEVVALPPTHPLLAPLLTTVPLQLLAAHIALARGMDVDQPRNLAKSVTVE